MFVLKGSIDNKLVLIQIMAWCQPGDKPLPGPVMSQFTDVDWSVDVVFLECHH